MIETIADRYNYATILLGKGKWKKALPIFKEVIKKYPCKEAYTNLGNCYRLAGLDGEMIACYNLALNPKIPFLDPATETHLHAMNNIGLTHYAYGNDVKAMEMYNRILEIKPSFIECIWNLSTAQLRYACSGHPEMFPTAWHNYNARFQKAKPVQLKNRKEGLKYWDCINKGDSIVVLAEQGIGDNIMFARYLPNLYRYFKKVYVQCEPSLAPLFESCGFRTVFDATQCEAMIAYPMCSLGGVFSTEPIPAGDWLRNKFNEKTEFKNFSVGIVWAGNPGHANDRYRSINIQRFHRLAKHCDLYSLSPGFSGDKYVKSLPIETWLDTIQHINGLDLVISIDTSVVHLCGSLGHAGWVLQPYKETDFRWGPASTDLATQSNIWYDSIRVFNNPQSWDFVFDNVEKELVKTIAAHRN